MMYALFGSCCLDGPIFEEHSCISRSGTALDLLWPLRHCPVHRCWAMEATIITLYLWTAKATELGH